VSRRWAPPKPKPPQRELFLGGRGPFTPAVKIATDTSADAAASVGIGPRGRDLAAVGDLAQAMVGVLDRHARDTRRAGVLLAVTVRHEVWDWLRRHPEGGTADEIAGAINRGILTVRPRVSELVRHGLVVDCGTRRANSSGRYAIVWVLRPEEDP
jgi:hypothetical protein